MCIDSWQQWIFVINFFFQSHSKHSNSWSVPHTYSCQCSRNLHILIRPSYKGRELLKDIFFVNLSHQQYFLIFGSTGAWTQTCMLSRQVLYHLSHFTSSIFELFFFFSNIESHQLFAPTSVIAWDTWLLTTATVIALELWVCGHLVLVFQLLGLGVRNLKL
jgi:hypothetical protein